MPPLDPDTLRLIFQSTIQPVLTAGTPPEDQPSLILLGGQPGAGKSSLTHAILTEQSKPIIPLSGDDLQKFYPDYASLVTRSPLEAGPILAEATSVWVRDSITHALDTRRSLLLEGTFHTPEVALNTAQRFKDAGYQTRIIAVATPRHQSLLSATARYLQDRISGRPARFTSLATHDRGWRGTRDLMGSLDGAPQIDRASVMYRDGTTEYDAHRTGEPQPFRGAADALDKARAANRAPGRNNLWLSDLRRVTRAVAENGELSPQMGELLIALHDEALRTVVPALKLPAESTSGPLLVDNITKNRAVLIDALRDLRPEPPSSTPPGPAPEPPTISR